VGHPPDRVRWSGARPSTHRVGLSCRCPQALREGPPSDSVVPPPRSCRRPARRGRSSPGSNRRSDRRVAGVSTYQAVARVPRGLAASRRAVRSPAAGRGAWPSRQRDDVLGRSRGPDARLGLAPSVSSPRGARAAASRARSFAGVRLVRRLGFSSPAEPRQSTPGVLRRILAADAPSLDESS